MMNKPTRFYSNKQEREVAKSLGGRQTSNSGATKFGKGDVVTDHILFECKTVTKNQTSVSIKKEWLEKNKQEAFAMRKDYGVLVFNFGPDTDNYYVLDERTFRAFKEFVEVTENEE